MDVVILIKINTAIDQQLLDQMNSITGWLDGSQVYGSDNVTAERLR